MRPPPPEIDVHLCPPDPPDSAWIMAIGWRSVEPVGARSHAARRERAASANRLAKRMCPPPSAAGWYAARSLVARGRLCHVLQHLGDQRAGSRLVNVEIGGDARHEDFGLSGGEATLAQWDVEVAHGIGDGLDVG